MLGCLTELADIASEYVDRQESNRFHCIRLFSNLGSLTITGGDILPACFNAFLQLQHLTESTYSFSSIGIRLRLRMPISVLNDYRRMK